MFIFRNLFPVAYEANGMGGGPAGAPGAQPAGDPGVQPEGQGAGGQGFNWGPFPDVPVEARAQLEPHLRNVQGYITQLEQQHAPFKAFSEAGYTPDTVQGLIQFDQMYSQDPLGAWLAMAKNLQERGVINEDLDLDAAAAIAMGQQVPAPQDPGQQMPGFDQIPPQFQQLIVDLQQRLERVEGGVQGFQAQQEQAYNNELLSRAYETMRETLQADGWAEEQLTDERLRGALIQAEGNVNQATKILQDLRTSLLTGMVAENRQTQQTGLQVANGGPKGQPQPRPRDRDSFGRARAGASQFLKSQNQAAAQGT